MTNRLELDLSRVTMPGGWFMVRPIRAAPFLRSTPSGPAADRAFEHVFTYRGSEHSILDAVLAMVRSARRKVFIASFRIGDERLLRELFRAVDRLHGGVYVITSWNEKRLRDGLAGLEDDAEADVAAQKYRYSQITQHGIALRGHEHCHAKFVVVDDQVALVSSANLETSALTGTSDRPPTSESGVVITERAEVQLLSRFFTRLWFAGCTSMAPPGSEYALQTRAVSTSPCAAPAPDVAPQPGLIWTHEEEQVIRKTILDVIGRARTELVMATYLLQGLSNSPDVLLDPLAAAVRRHGLQASILLRGQNHKPDHRRDAMALAEAGLHVHADSVNHAKAVIADGRHGALFSANFDLTHGLLNGVEVGARLDGHPALTEARRFLSHAMANADLEFAVDPTQERLDRSFAAGWRQPWPYGDQVEVTAADPGWRALSVAILQGPVLYTAANRDKIAIHAGGGEWALARLADSSYRLDTVRSMGPRDGAATLLKSWLGRPKEVAERRGFCPARLVRA